MASTAVYGDEVTPADVALAGGKQFLESYAVVAADASGTQAGGTALTAQLNAVASGTSGYSVTLPPSRPGMAVTIVLTTASTTCKVFPNAGFTPTETINALAANAAITMAARTSATFYCPVAGQWYTSPRVPS
jgi:hypothetical protein